MRKFVPLVFVVALSFSFAGCVSSLEKNWGLKEEGDGYVSQLMIDNGEVGREAYCATIVYCGKEANARVSGEIYEKLVVGRGVKLKLASAMTRNENDANGERFCDATYWWWIPEVTDGYRLVTFRLP